MRLKHLALVLSLAAVGCSRDSAVDGVDDERLAQAASDTANWLTHGRTYDEQRFSPLRAIDAGNVSRLGLVWSRDLNTTRGLEATPLVVDGVIYTTGSWSVVYAVEARTGNVLWTYDPAVPRSRARVFCCDVVNRGVALYKGKVFVGTMDGRLVAIDARAGTRVWETMTVDTTKPYSITGAPRIANGMVLIGNGGAEMGVRGYVSAYDAENGSLEWRTFTVPGDPSKGFESEAMRLAAATWKGRWWEGGGGGTAWDAIVYDPALDLVYVGTGNGSPWYRDLRSPGGGDNLYLSSIIALRAKTGEQVWHHQTTPGDNWDYTATQPLMLAELAIGGRARRVIMQAPKNGFFYVLDRETGDVISAREYAKISWATGFDSLKARPIESPSAYAGMKPVVVSPDPTGAHGWHPMAFNPQTGLVYLPVRDGTIFVHAPDSTWRPSTTTRNEGRNRTYAGPLLRASQGAPPPTGRLVAWDPVKQEARWRVDHPVLMSGGVLTTAGDLVFQGLSDGMLLAYRASDGAKLWEFDAGTGIMAPPVTYLVDGTQYVTLMVGWGGDMGLINPPPVKGAKPGYGRILTFALGGTTPLQVAALRPDSLPAIRQQGVAAAPAAIEEGRKLYATYCFSCHGVNAVAGALPDLRYASADVHRDFEAIVLQGARVAGGMPSFADLLTPAQARAIQAYVVRRAREAASQ
ncbi:MAG: PQQ-dependent dehydrogenase, methanol/ethanol family [Gemmatimonadaceae bacterium]